MSLEVHWSHGIACGLVLAVSGWVSVYMCALLLIFPTPSIKMCFLMCGSIPFETTERFLLCLKIKFYYQFNIVMLNH